MNAKQVAMAIGDIIGIILGLAPAAIVVLCLIALICFVSDLVFDHPWNTMPASAADVQECIEKANEYPELKPLLRKYLDKKQGMGRWDYRAFNHEVDRLEQRRLRETLER